MIKGLFFDLDGTLVNTYQADFQAYRDAILEVASISISEAEFAKTHGQEMNEKLGSLAPNLPVGDVSKVAAAKKRHYNKYVNSTVANKSLIQFIDSFAGHCLIGLVTTAKHDNAIKVLREHNLERYFSFMVFGDDVEYPKPHPEPYLRALRLSGLNPSDVIVFEDTETGIKSAESAGLAVIHVKEFIS